MPKGIPKLPVFPTKDEAKKIDLFCLSFIKKFAYIKARNKVIKIIRKYIAGNETILLVSGLLVRPQKISTGCKKYKFNKTKLRSCISSLKISFRKNPIRINKYIVATEIKASMILLYSFRT